jgi:hypothetical protein
MAGDRKVSLATRLEVGGSLESIAQSGHLRGEARLQKAAIAMPEIMTSPKMKAPIAGSDQGLASRHLVPSRTQRRGRWGREREGYSYASTVGSPARRRATLDLVACGFCFY